jgi:hypothetical protein
MRTNLNVPFSENHKVKRLGAKWDLARKTWYVEDVVNLEPFLPWIADYLKKPVKAPPRLKPKFFSKKHKTKKKT